MIKKLCLGAITTFALFTGFITTANALDSNAVESNKYLNKDTYITNEGETNTIYWASGIEAPKMAADSELNDPKNPTKEGYFYSVNEKTNDGHVRQRYEYPVEVNKGYYDFNKNFSERGDKESPLCYLVSSANILLWWMDQNMVYIDKYLEDLKAGEIYEDLEGGKKLLPYDEKLWSFVHERPSLKAANGFLQTEMGLSRFVTTTLTKYYNKGLGSYPDRVFDLFINGYQYEGNIQNGIDPNNENNFRPDSTGGYFYPVFGNNIISKRVDKPSYTFYSSKIKELLTSGVGITLTYRPATAGILHSVTLWGAEYDENDNLTRVYLTDSDDPDNAIKGFDGRMYSRGLFSAEVRADKDGGMHITDIADENVLGPIVLNLTVLDLAQDYWEDATNNNSKSIDEAKITATSNDVNIPLGATVNLSIEALKEKRGYLRYQWYEATEPNKPGIKIAGETNNTLSIKTKHAGNRYYYCEVTNHKNGKQVKTNSRYIKVYADSSIPLIDAQKPINTEFLNGRQQVVQFMDKNLTTKAKSPDGGRLSYQWYKSSNMYKADRVKIEGATDKNYRIPTDEVGVFYYFPVITNTLDSATNIKSKSWEPDYAKEITINPAQIEEIIPMASLVISYDGGLNPTNVKLRLGARIDDSLIDSSKEYGMIVLSNNDYTNIEALNFLDSQILADLKAKGFAIGMNPAHVPTKGYSQFSWVINNLSKESYGFDFRAYAYEYDKLTGVVRKSRERIINVYDIKNTYIADQNRLGLSNEIIKVLEKI